MPTGWNNRTPKIWVILALTGAGGVYCTTKAVLAVMQTHWIAAAIAACAAVVLLIAAVGMAFVLFGRNRLRASFDATGTTLRVGRTMFWWLTVWFGATIVALVLFLLDGSHLGGWAADFRMRSFGWLGLALAAAVVGLGLVARASRREPPRLCLSAAGVDLRDAAGQFTLAWNDITNITGETPSAKGFRPIVFEHGNQTPSVIGGASGYAPDGAVLFWLIRHYWRHPEARGELTNGVAIERLTAKAVSAE